MSKKILLVGLLSMIFGGCSIALDTDELQKENTPVDTGTGDGPKTCTTPEDCDDGIDCTNEVCDEGVCQESIPDNDLCEPGEMCKRGQGCIPTGNECEVGADCDDGIDCTNDTCTLGKCYNTPHDEACQDTDLCLINAVCDAEDGCSQGEQRKCDDTDELEDTDVDLTCRHVVCNPSDGLCSMVEILPGADKDSDGYFDPQNCADGSDCDDADSSIHPGAAELCDFRDNDCDGATDLAVNAGPTTVVDQWQTAIESPAVAHNGQNFAVTWQQGAGNSAVVYAKIFDSTGEETSSSIDLTAALGEETIGRQPHVIDRGNDFLMVWVVDGDAQNPSLRLMDFSLNASTSSITTGTSSLLTTGDATDVRAPRLTYDPDTGGGPGWVAAWMADYADATSSVDVRAQGVAAAFSIDRKAGSMDSFSIESINPNDYIVAYARPDDASDSDIEVFETNVTLATDIWQTEADWPALLSAASSTLTDPSWKPLVANSISGWFTIFTDIAVPDGATEPEEDWDIRGIWSTAIETIVAVFENTSTSSTRPSEQAVGLIYTGTGFGLLYVKTIGLAQSGTQTQTLDFRALDGTGGLLQSGGLDVTQAGRLVGAESGKEIRAGRLIKVGSGFATTWVESTSAGDTLKFAGFEGCTPNP